VKHVSNAPGHLQVGERSANSVIADTTRLHAKPGRHFRIGTAAQRFLCCVEVLVGIQLNGTFAAAPLPLRRNG